MNVNGIDIQIERKTIKNIHLSVYPPDGRVHISAPEDIDDERLRLFALGKLPWIREKIATLTSYKIQPERRFVSGETHYFLGSKKKIYIYRECNSSPFIVKKKGDNINITVHQDTKPNKIEELLYSWYKDELVPLISNFVDKWSKIIGVAPQEWNIQQMSKRWGSCMTAKRKLIFNIQLAKKPLICIEYVVAHEMLHLIERTHNARFQRLMDTYFPNWERIRKELNEFPL